MGRRETRATVECNETEIERSTFGLRLSGNTRRQISRHSLISAFISNDRGAEVNRGTLSLGGIMTASSVAQSAPITDHLDAVKVDRASLDNGRYQIGRGQLLAQHVGSVTFRQQEFSSGFVDFLLGRRARNPR